MPKKLKYFLKPIDYDSSAIGKRIAKLRKRKGLTQKELGSKIGITQTLVSDYETGRSHLSDFMLIRFALSLNTTPNDILGFKIENKVNHNTHSLKLIKRINRIEKLPISKQKALLQIIDGYLDSAGV
jgi:transcriptional regulator with XRE-family HTH domain